MRDMIRRETASVQARTRYLEETLLPLSYMYVGLQSTLKELDQRDCVLCIDSYDSAFTQLVHDNQFLALGLVLLAQLSEIRSIITTHGLRDTSTIPLISVDSAARATFPSAPREDLGEPVERPASGVTLAMVNPATVKNNVIETQNSPMAKVDPPISAPMERILKPIQSADTPYSKQTETDLPVKSEIVLAQKDRKKTKGLMSKAIDDLFKDLS